jgi:hypothetical protein
MQGILLGSKIGGNYCSTCGFPTIPKYLIGKILRYFYNQGLYKTHLVSKFE